MRTPFAARAKSTLIAVSYVATPGTKSTWFTYARRTWRATSVYVMRVLVESGMPGESQASCPVGRSVPIARVSLLWVQSDSADGCPVASASGPPAGSAGPSLRVDAVSRSEDGPVAPFMTVARAHEANPAV